MAKLTKQDLANIAAIDDFAENMQREGREAYQECKPEIAIGCHIVAAIARSVSISVTKAMKADVR